MPELPEVETARRLIAPVLEGRRIVRVLLRRADLRRPFPPRFAERVRGRTIRTVSRRGKYLLAELSSGETIVLHLGMSGSLRVERGAPTSAPDRHDHVIVEVAGGARVIFNDPRRFGMMDLAPGGDLSAMGGVGTLGPEPLSPEFTAPRWRARVPDDESR